MCCCQPELPHDESEKFVLNGSEANKNQVVFEKSEIKFGRQETFDIQGKDIKPKQEWISKTDNSSLRLYKRNNELHQLINFMVDREKRDYRILIVTGLDEQIR